MNLTEELDKKSADELPDKLADKLADKLSRYANSLEYEDLTQAVIHKAKQRVIDAVSCAFCAFDAGIVKKSLRLSQAFPGDYAGILGTRRKASPDLATFINGTMVRYLDYNDGYIGREVGHPSDNIAPCLAIAQRQRASGRELILAIVLAYEIQCRFQDAACLFRNGWDHVNYILIASALAAGKLMDLPPAQLTQAVNIAVNGHMALRQVRSGELSSWKGCSAANAARNAVFSTLLASQGFTGPSPIFEGEMGFFKQITGEFDMDPEGFGGRRDDFMILRSLTKMFPTNGELQTAVWAALDLKKQIPDLSEIESLTIETTEVGYKFTGKDPEKWQPQSRETADHSLPYTVARALFDGDITIESYAASQFKDPTILEFMKKIRVRENKDFTALLPKLIPNGVTLTLTSGEILSKTVYDARGGLNTPMEDRDFENKFNKCTQTYFSKSRRESILAYLWELDKETNIDRLFDILAIDAE